MLRVTQENRASTAPRQEQLTGTSCNALDAGLFLFLDLKPFKHDLAGQCRSYFCHHGGSSE